ncbi:MAG: diaminopimelate decarboxylase [Gammaproteobacteria bacterium]|nr:diaminopimelate decarboxylase [Gammaproteobacteria bacterium]
MQKIKETYPTPFHLYQEKELIEHANRFQKAFSVFPGFQEYFAVKATPNPIILKLLKDAGFGADCSSLAELILSEKVGITGEQIMFTSNDTELYEFAKAKELGAIINLDDIKHIDFIHEGLGLPDLLCFRYNPGPLREGNAIIGDPKEAKYGFTRDQLFEGYKKCKELGVKRFGLHTMVISNELNPDFFVETAIMLFELVAEIKNELDIDIEFVNLGGGIGVAYRPGETPVDYDYVANKVMQEYQRLIEPIIKQSAREPLKIYMECGRVITAPYDYLITDVIHMKHTYKDYVGTNATMANLMRPGMYGAYHHISVLGKEDADCDHTYDVTGSLCENNDKFAVDRQLPEVEVGDIIAIHDAGAHGHSMGFNYNGKLRSAELLLREDGSVLQIRRAETLDDYFATLDFEQIKDFN